jgi:hypothetical protein
MPALSFFQTRALIDFRAAEVKMPHRPIGVTAARLMLRRQPIKNPLLSEGDIA